MPFRVPLLFPVALVIERVDPAATDAAGRYHPVFRTTIQADESNTIGGGVSYSDAIRVPVQMEIEDDEALRAVGLGDAPVSNEVYIAHRRDLHRLGLLANSSVYGEPLINKRDRITSIEKKGFPGVTVRVLPEPLYILQVEAGSPGMGPAGHDLVIIYVEDRNKLDR